MKTKFSGILTLFLAFLVQLSFAQEKTIAGTIVDENNLPLPGVNVFVSGTNAGAQTDFDGNYSIAAAAGSTITYSFVGYKTVTKTVGGANNISFAMEVDVAAIEEVVIVAYGGATENSKIASSIATVSGETLEQIPISSLDQLLQGAAAGVNVNVGSGQPGQSGTIIIRGRNSISGNIEPLYVIDGVPVDGDNFRSLNPNDIKTFSVLKDASATAIYGNRGAGGVILITTKQGKRNTGTKIEYRTLYGLADKPKSRFQVMNAFQFLNFQKNLLPGNQFGDSLSDAQINALANQSNTNWEDIFFDQGTTASHQLSFTSGGEKSTSYTSVQYFEQAGITLGSDLQRFSFRNNQTGSSNNDKFRYASNITLNHSVSNFIVDAARGNNTGGQLDNPFLVPYIGLPYLSAFNPDGSVNIIGNQLSGAYDANGNLNANGATGFLNTPFLALNAAKLNTDQESEIKAIGSIKLDYDITKDITVGSFFGLDYTYSQDLAIIAPESLRGLTTPTIPSLVKGSQSENYYRDARFTTYAYLRYTKDVTEKLNVNAAVFGEYNYTNTQNAGFTGFGLNPALPGSSNGITPGNTIEFPNDSNNDGVNDPIDAVYNYIPNLFSFEAELALASVFGTVDIDYDDRFGFSGTIRRDQTSRFPKNSTGTFWSVAGRWNIDNESFLENSDLISTLKLRLSYGIVGSQDVGFGVPFGGNRVIANRYQGLQTVAANPGYQLGQGYTLGTLVDENIKWETTNQFNTGLSFGLWNNRLSGEVDFYRNFTEDLFANKPLSLAGTGYANVQTNVADMSNTGVDLQLGYDILQKTKGTNWGLRIHANGNYNKNEVESLPGGFTGNTLRTAEGRPIFTWFLPRWAGVDPSNGQPLYLDLDGNVTNVFNPNDAVYLDKNFDPTYTGGFGADITFKRLTLNSLFSFAADRWRRNGSLAIIEDAGLAGFANQSVSLLNAWTTPGQITDIPALSNGGLRAVQGDRYLEDASFLRLRNVTLAYNLNKDMLKKTNVFTGIRMYLQGTNLLTWTKWRGFDPEGDGATGFFDFPTPRTYTIGFDVTF